MFRQNSSSLIALLFACSTLAVVPAARAQQPTAAPSTQPATLAADKSAKVDALVKQLGDDAWQARQKAQDELVRMGTDIRDRLAQVLKETRDEEVRTRVEAIIRQMDENRATGTSIITIHLPHAQPREVFAELSKQCNAPMRTMPANLWESRSFEPKDIEIERQPFWIALREICNAYGLSPQQNGMDRDMLIGDRNLGQRVLGDAPFTVNGPFMVAATYINRSQYVDLNQPKNVRRNCNVQLMVYAEPKMKVLQGSYAAKIEEAVDEKGNSLMAPAMGQEGMLNPGNSWMWSLSCNLVPQAGGGDRIARLKGTGRFVVQTRSEVAEIADVLNAKNVTKTIGGKRFTLKEVRKTQENVYEAQVTLYKSGWSPNEWNFVFNNTFKLVDGKGNALMRTNPGFGGGGGETMEIKAQFQRNMWNNGEIAGEPVKLVWEVPIETKEVVVPFEFKDLPLP